MSSWQGVSIARVQSATVAVTAPVFNRSRLTPYGVLLWLSVMYSLLSCLPHTWQDRLEVLSFVYSQPLHYPPPLPPYLLPFSSLWLRLCRLPHPLPLAGHSSEALRDQPDPASLPHLPTFTPAGGPSSSGLDVLAAAAANHLPKSGDLPSNARGSLHSQGPYNMAASLPPEVLKKILAFEFVQMSELRGNIWPDDSTTDATTPGHLYQVQAVVLCENGGRFSIASSREGPRTLGLPINNSRGRSLRGGQLGGIRQADPPRHVS